MRQKNLNVFNSYGGIDLKYDQKKVKICGIWLTL